MVPSGPVRATFADGFDRPLEEIVVHDDLEHDFAQEVQAVLLSPIQLDPSAVSAEPLAVADRHPEHFDLFQRLANRVEFERLNDGHNQFHAEVFVRGFGEIVGWHGVLAGQWYPCLHESYRVAPAAQTPIWRDIATDARR